MVAGAAVAIVITPFLVYGLPSWLVEAEGYRRLFLRTMPNFVFFTLYIVCLAEFMAGLLLFVLGHCREAKLKRLKKMGKAYMPVMVEVVPREHDGYWVAKIKKRDIKSFTVKCSMRNSKGDEFVIKSGRIAVCNGLRVVMQPPNVAAEAVVYVNPEKPWDYAVEVKLR